MARVSTSAARTNFADAMNRVAYRGERIVLERRGKALAALIPIEDLELLEAIEDRKDYDEAVRVLDEMRERGESPVPLAEVKRNLGIR